MKIKWLDAGVTAVGSPDRAEGAVLEIFSFFFWPIQAAFVVGEPLSDVGIPYLEA